METVRGMFGPDVTFLGVPRVDLGALVVGGQDVVVLGAPFDSGTSHRAGARFGSQAIRTTDYLPHDGSRPDLALGLDPLAELRVADAGDVLMPPGSMAESLSALEAAVTTISAAGALPVILGGDHTVTFPDATGVARHAGWGRVSLIHFDAHADTGEVTAYLASRVVLEALSGYAWRRRKLAGEPVRNPNSALLDGRP